MNKKTIIIILIIIATILILSGVSYGVVSYIKNRNLTSSSQALRPTNNPTNNPTSSPTSNPTGSPTSNPTGSPTGSPEPTISSSKSRDWVANIYKTMDWSKMLVATDNTSSPVPSNWANWAKTSNTSMLQYFVNVKLNKNDSSFVWPATDSDIKINPIYSWDGLVTATYLWNRLIELNNSSSTKPLGNILGFLNEQDELRRKMTLTCFLGNAVVESASFMVCKESTILAVKNTDGSDIYCPALQSPPAGINGNALFNPRYFNNCDNANPSTYSCKGDSGSSNGGAGVTGSCFNPNPDQVPTADIMCNIPSCVNTTDTSIKNFCLSGNNGTQFAVYDDTVVKDVSACSVAGGNARYNFWCPASTPAPTTKPPSSNTVFNPVTDNCTGGWPVCQPAYEINLSTDPCMTDPHADLSYTDKLDNSSPTCTDWNGNRWQEQQQCYFGHGIIQLTWSCNYYMTQRILTKMANLISSSETDPILSSFKSSMNKPLTDPSTINVCANPDILCGDITIDPVTSKVTYSSDLIKQSMPWLACISYWATKVAPDFNKCYSYLTALTGIGPAGGAGSGRLWGMKSLLVGLGENINDTTIFNNTDSNICLKLTNCNTDCTYGSSGGGGGGGGGGSSGNNYCSIASGTWSDTSQQACKNKIVCTTPDDCKANQTAKSLGLTQCYAGITC